MRGTVRPSNRTLSPHAFIEDWHIFLYLFRGLVKSVPTGDVKFHPLSHWYIFLLDIKDRYQGWFSMIKCQVETMERWRVKRMTFQRRVNYREERALSKSVTNLELYQKQDIIQKWIQLMLIVNCCQLFKNTRKLSRCILVYFIPDHDLSLNLNFTYIFQLLNLFLTLC